VKSFYEQIGLCCGQEDSSPYLTQYGTIVDIESEVAYLVITSTQHHRDPDRAIQAAGDGSDEFSMKGRFWPELSC
jgi:hypothetical protein